MGRQKADLRELVQCSMLQDGQKLIFHYQEKLSKEYEAKIMSGDLLWNSELYSMSKLVAVILKDEGYDIPSEAYRGPAYWHNGKGKSIKELWEQYLLESY